MLRTALPEIITDTLPGPKAQALIDRRAQAVPAAIRCVYPVAIARGEGAMLEDLDGNRFLDWIGGVGVLNIGYSHPEGHRRGQGPGGTILSRHVQHSSPTRATWPWRKSWPSWPSAGDGQESVLRQLRRRGQRGSDQAGP